MSGVWQTVRVFISSTFRDMHAERDHLVKAVAPALRERLEPYRVYLVDVDLRWGVTKEQAENNRAVQLCLQQVDECRPFFLGLLGGRYGWVPTVLPAELLARHPWVRHHPGKSVTDLEMLYGSADKGQQRRALFYFRDPAALDGIPDDRRADFAETDPGQVDKREALKRRIRRLGYTLCDGYPAHWDAAASDRPSKGHGRLGGLQEFGRRVEQDLWQAIQAELHLPDTPPSETITDPLAEEQDYHERFAESRLRVYVGRADVQQALLAYASSDAGVPLLLTGPSGLGKSAALARLFTDYRRQHPDALVVPHFIGASPDSTSLRALLRRLCLTLSGRFGLAGTAPEETGELFVAFRDLLGQAPPGQRVLLVLDALNQLDAADQEYGLLWLAPELPPHVKVVASCISDADRAEPMLAAFQDRPHRRLRLDPARRGTARGGAGGAVAVCQDAGRPADGTVAVQPGHGQPAVLAGGAGGTAWLRLLRAARGAHRLPAPRGRHGHGPVRPGVAAPRRGVRRRTGADRAGLAGVGAARPVRARAARAGGRGGTPRRRRPVSGAAAVAALPAQSGGAARLLPPQPRQGGAAALPDRRGGAADGARCPGRILPEAGVLAGVAGGTAAAGPEPPPTPRPTNTRKVDEVHWPWLQARQWDEAAALLLDLQYVEAKAEAGLVFDLAGDFTQTLQAVPPQYPQRRLLNLLEEAVRRDLHFLNRHPEALFQCLWNSGWWYDCPEAARHYLPPADGTGSGPPPWHHPGPKLSVLLESCAAPRSR